MRTLRSRLRGVVARQRRRVAHITGVEAAFRALREQAAEQERRIAELERKVQEGRRLNQRLAEFTDVVAEILVPVADRDDTKLAVRLAAYNRASL